MKVAINITTEHSPLYAIVVETIACYEALLAIVSAIDLGYVSMTPRCRVLRQRKLADMN